MSEFLSQGKEADFRQRRSLAGLHGLLPIDGHENFHGSQESYQDIANKRRDSILNGPQMRSMRLIGNSNPRYRWHRYYKTTEELKGLKQPIRKYYERINALIAQYHYIDRLLDSSLPHNLIGQYESNSLITQGNSADRSLSSAREDSESHTELQDGGSSHSSNMPSRITRNRKDIYRLPVEETPLLEADDDSGSIANFEEFLNLQANKNEGAEPGEHQVTAAVYIFLVEGFLVLLGKAALFGLSNSFSILASLVNSALDFLSTIIMWRTTKMISQSDQNLYPVGLRRLEPIGFLVFSVITVTAFIQVALECLYHLKSLDKSLVQLGFPAFAIVGGSIAIETFSWMWCGSIKSSSVQVLVQDIMTDAIFSIFSIIFPIVGFYTQAWWLDAFGGLLLSSYVLIYWIRTASKHIRKLSGQAGTADERSILLYLTMRFAKSIKMIDGLQTYHTGDKLNVEVDIVLPEMMSLRDSHDLGQSLQYVLESVPIVDRAFVQQDYVTHHMSGHLS